mgnify:CR=1 FL=1
MNRGNLAEDPRIGRPSGSRYAHPGMDETNHLLYVSDRDRKVRSKGAEGQEKDARSKIDRSFTERRLKLEEALEERSEAES